MTVHYVLLKDTHDAFICQINERLVQYFNELEAVRTEAATKLECHKKKTGTSF